MQSVLFEGYAGWFLESGQLSNSESIAITASTTPATAFELSGDQTTLTALFNPASSTQSV
jgi:hypothetical protein